METHGAYATHGCILLMKKKVLLTAFLVIITTSLFSFSINVRSYDHQGYTRIVFESQQPFQFNLDTSSDALEVKLQEKADVEQNIQVFNKSRLLDRMVHRWEDKKSVFRVSMKSSYNVKRSFVLERPFRVVVDLAQSKRRAAKKTTPVPVKKNPRITLTPQSTPKTTGPRETKPGEPGSSTQEEGDREQAQEEDEPQDQPKPVVPFNQKKRPTIQTICIDPGHGGTDLGAVGKSKINEKDLTLAVGKKLRRMVESRLGLTVVMTRDSDEEVSLNTRVSKANNREAQLFVSIHVNSSYRRSARGPETYYVSLKATDQDAFRLSQKENSSFEEIEKMADNDNLKMILWNMAQTEYIKESSKLADFIQYELNVLMHTRNRGVKQAPFRVLMRAAMSAVLVEIAFLSNRGEEKQMQSDEFLGKVAGAIYRGISKYIYYYNNISQ